MGKRRKLRRVGSVLWVGCMRGGQWSGDADAHSHIPDAPSKSGRWRAGSLGVVLDDERSM